MLMEALAGVPVSSGFVGRALERFAQRLAAAGFDDTMRTALRPQDVWCADETPTNVVSTDIDKHGAAVVGSPYAVTVRTPDARLVWYAPISSRSKTAIAALGVLEDYAGYLLRDDYAGYYQFNAQLAGVQQCAAHLIRHCKGVLELHPSQQNWAGEVITVLREAAAAVTDATPQPQPARPRAARRPARPLRPRSHLGHRHQPAPHLGQRQPPGYTSPNASTTKPTRSRPSPEISPCPERTPPVSKPSRPQTISGHLRLLAHPDHSRRLLPRPLLSGHRPQPRRSPHRRHPRRPHRQPWLPTVSMA
jgi:Transposase IS66 family